MATKQINPKIILKLVAEDRPYREMARLAGCGDTLIYRAVSDLSAQGLIERKRGAATRGASGYRLTPLGYEQVGSFTPPAPKPTVKAMSRSAASPRPRPSPPSTMPNQAATPMARP